MLMSVETAHSPNAAQCSLDDAKCKQGKADNPALCPLARSSGVLHWKIQHSLSVHLWRSCRSKFKARGGVRIQSIADEPRFKFGLAFGHRQVPAVHTASTSECGNCSQRTL